MLRLCSKGYRYIDYRTLATMISTMCKPCMSSKFSDGITRCDFCPYYRPCTDLQNLQEYATKKVEELENR